MSASRLIDCGAGVRLERAVPYTMSDGVKLYADHYYPPGGGQQPTLLMRQPYGRDIASTVVYAHPAWFARHGYNVIIQDVRGRGDSEGEFYPFRNEARDGAETIALLRTRPEANGRVGMYGFSYQGMTQWLAAAEQPAGLECIAPAQTAHDLYRGWFYRNGTLRLASSLGWGLQMLREDARRRNLREASEQLERAWVNLPAQYLATPYGAHPAIHSEGLPQYVSDWFEHDTPGPYWSTLDISDKVACINIPALHLSGWYDTYLTGSIDGFMAMREHSPAREHHYLLAGPWSHIPWGDRIGSAHLGPQAILDTDALHLRWFNHWLKDSGEFAAEPRIRHFAQGENRWHSADDFPAEPTHTLFLHSHGRANSSKGDGTLALASPSADEPPDIFLYDPEVPVASPGGLPNASGPTNQAALELGNNVLIYTTEPLQQPLHVFGAPHVTIYLAHSARHTDLVAKLVDVHPNGDATFLTLGIARSQSHFPTAEAAADRIREWTFALDATSSVFATGHRLRLEVASSAYPLFDRNPNNATPARAADSWTWQRSTQTIFHDTAYPSALHLPLAQEAR
jgi:putative CocE/NonD family hydrolase